MKIDPSIPWNQLLDQVPILNNIFSVAAVFGVVLLAWTFFSWLWSHRRSGGSSGFPWTGIIICGILIAPRVLAPLVLWLLGVIITFFVMAFEAAQNIFG